MVEVSKWDNERIKNWVVGILVIHDNLFVLDTILTLRSLYVSRSWAILSRVSTRHWEYQSPMLLRWWALIFPLRRATRSIVWTSCMLSSSTFLGTWKSPKILESYRSRWTLNSKSSSQLERNSRSCLPRGYGSARTRQPDLFSTPSANTSGKLYLKKYLTQMTIHSIQRFLAYNKKPIIMTSHSWARDFSLNKSFKIRFWYHEDFFRFQVISKYFSIDKVLTNFKNFHERFSSFLNLKIPNNLYNFRMILHQIVTPTTSDIISFDFKENV